MKKLKPTIGLSFGLPHQGGGGYPYSPHSVYPHHGTVDATGINLGLVSVNPLLSVQFSKDDYGNKVIKPFVNLHFTPNSYLVHKFEDLVSYKKGIILNKHKHYHVHKEHPYLGYEGPYREHPSEFHHPEIIHEPPHYHHEPPHYPEPYPHHYHHSPEIYDQPPPSHFHHQDFFPSPPPEAGGYFDDPLNYGGGYHHDSFLGRALNNLSYSPGLSLLDQYQQKYHNSVDSYGNPVRLDQLSTNSIEKLGDDTYPLKGFRGGKSVNFEGGKVTFPTSRRKRDLDQQTISEGRSKNEKVIVKFPQRIVWYPINYKCSVIYFSVKLTTLEDPKLVDHVTFAVADPSDPQPQQ